VVRSPRYLLLDEGSDTEEALRGRRNLLAAVFRLENSPVQPREGLPQQSRKRLIGESPGRTCAGPGVADLIQDGLNQRLLRGLTLSPCDGQLYGVGSPALGSAKIRFGKRRYLVQLIDEFLGQVEGLVQQRRLDFRVVRVVVGELVAHLPEPLPPAR